MGDWGMARAWKLWEPHKGEYSQAVGFWGVVWGGGACVGIGSVCMYFTEY